MWSLLQSNECVVTVDIAQPRDPGGNLADGVLHGAAKIPGLFDLPIAEANLTGALRGDEFELRADWPNQTNGHYLGHFDPTGRLSGITFDLANPGQPSHVVPVGTSEPRSGTHAARSSEIFCQIFRDSPIVNVSTSLTVSSTTASVDSSAHSAAVLEIRERISLQ